MSQSGHDYYFTCAVIAGFLAGALMTIPPVGYAAETVQVPTTVDIIESIALYCEVPGLTFGEISAGPTPGTVTVAFGGGRTAGGGVGLGRGGATPIRCTTKGAGGRRYLISLPDGPVTLTNTSGPGVMWVTNVRTQNVNRVFGTSGTDAFDVVGTLNVDADQPPGEYTGTFIVNVSYA